MSLLRRRLPWLVCVWLACQLAGYAAAPFALCCEEAALSTLPECCQGVGPGETCPMHHDTDAGDSTCKMRNACASAESALVSLAGGVGVLPPPTIDVIVFPAGERLTSLSASALLRVAPPDSPPPRA